MQHRTRTPWLACALLAASLVLPGCGGGSSGGKNVFNFYEPSNLKGLDPLLASTTYSHRAVSNMYEGLLQYSYLKRPYQVEPQLATKMPTISDDGLTYTFEIQKGVLFHDDDCFPNGIGRELKVDDFFYSWKRIADVNNTSEGWWIFDGRIAGLNEFREGTKGQKDKVDYSAKVEGLEKIDDYTLKIKLTKPYPQLLYILTMGYTKAVPREAVEKYGQEFLNHPVGTGPYRLKSWTKNSKLIMVKNKKWRGEKYPTEGEASDKKNGNLDDAGKQLPFIDKVVVNIMIESQPRWLQFMRGDLELIAPPKDNYDSAMPGGKLSPEMKRKGMRNINMPRMDLTYSSFNMDDPFLGFLSPDNPDHADAIKERKEKYPTMDNHKAADIRRALSLAYDRDKLIELFYNGRALPAKGPIPPGLEGYEADWVNEWSEYNPAKAKEMLAKAGFPEGKGMPTLEYQTTSGTTGMQMAQFRKQLYKAVGVDMNINTNTWPELNKKVKTKRAQFFGMAWQGDYPDAQNFLQLFYGPNQSPGPNGTNYKNPEYDALYDEIITMMPSAERTEKYKKMARLVAHNCPMSLDTHRITDTIVHGWFKNYKPHDAGHGNWKYYRIDTEMRKKLKPEIRK